MNKISLQMFNAEEDAFHVFAGARGHTHSVFWWETPTVCLQENSIGFL